MSREADYYILDEPIAGVDPLARDVILKNFNEKSSLIICTHLISDIEKILDEVIFISRGKILLQSNADKLREEKDKSINDIFKEEYACLTNY